MKLFTLSALLFLGLHSQALGQGQDTAAEDHSNHGGHSQDHAHPGLQCYQCAFTPTAENNQGNPSCENPKAPQANVPVIPCLQHQACGFWAGKTSIGFTIIRSCSSHNLESSDCSPKETLKDSIDLESFKISLPLSEGDSGKVGNKSEWCAGDRCNYGSTSQPCIGLHGSHDGHHGGNGVSSSTALTSILYNVSFLLLNFLVILISMP